MNNTFQNIKKARSAFTLIELLVVIAIIAILAAILFPVFARARENARRSSCQSNLKQIGLGILQYAQDFDEKYPMYRVDQPTTPIPVTAVYGWADAVQPYIKSTQLYQCPSETTAPTPPDATYPNPAVQSGYCDYVYNVALGSQPSTGAPATGSGASLSALEQSSLTMMAMDGKQNGSNASVNTADNGSARMSTRGSGSGAGLAQASNFNTSLHLAGCNMLFADGHVKWQKGRDGAPTYFATIYNTNTPFSVSENNFTMHPYDVPVANPQPVFQYSSPAYP